MVKNGTSASPAMARASSVLPVPGGPTSSTPLGILPPRRWNFCGSLRNSTISCELLLGLVDAGHVVEGDAADLLGQQARAALAEAHGLAAARLHLAHEEDPDADQQQHREPGDEDIEQRMHIVVGGRRVDLDLFVFQLADQVGVVRRIGGKAAAVLHPAADVRALDGHADDIALARPGPGTRNRPDRSGCRARPCPGTD